MAPDGTGQFSPTCLLHPSGNLAQVSFVVAARASAEIQDCPVKLLLASGFPNSHWPNKADTIVKLCMNMIGRSGLYPCVTNCYKLSS